MPAAEVLSVSQKKANKVRKKPLRVILNGLGKDLSDQIPYQRHTYVGTKYDPYKTKLKKVFVNPTLKDFVQVNCYSANSVPEGVAIMWKEGVTFLSGIHKPDVSSTSSCRYIRKNVTKKRKYFSICIRWWYRTCTSPGQHGGEFIASWYDRCSWTYAF